MPTYRAEMPPGVTPEHIELLRGLGAVRFVFEVEADSRRKVVRDLGNEYGWLGWDADWWGERLSGGRKPKETDS